MIKIGLTGGIGAGKSETVKFLKQLLLPIIDADVITRSLSEYGTPQHKKIQAAFPEAIKSNNIIDRKKLRNIIFMNPIKRQCLEEILHHGIRQRIQSESQAIDAICCIIVMPLLIESGMKDLVDKIVVVDCDEQKQVERVIKRDKCNKNEALNIVNSQINRFERLKNADFVIHNNGSLENLKQEVQTLYSIWIKNLH